MLCILSMFIIGCTKHIDPIKPDTNGNGVYKGLVSLDENFEQSYKGLNPVIWGSDISGTLVEIIGTNKSAFTNKGGYFYISGLDSGKFTIKITRTGYEPFLLTNQYNNGKDTSELTFTLKDTSGYAHDYTQHGIYLYESSVVVSAVNVMPVAQELIVADTITSDTSKYKGQIFRDTTYTIDAQFTLNVQHPLSWTRDSLPIGFYATVSEFSSLSQSNYPTQLYPTTAWKGFVGIPDGILHGNRTYLITRNGKEKNSVSLDISTIVHQRGKNLYLHIIPIYYKKYRYIMNAPGQKPCYNIGTDKTIGKAESFPIQWK